MMTYEQILSKLTAICSSAEHCSGEMTEKMCKWEVDEPTQARVMQYLVSEKYVDDERYARCFVREKIRFNKWGRKKIEQALYLKHIDKSISAQVLDEVPEQDYLSVLRPLIRNKEKSIKARSEYEKNMKLIRFALSRGFSFDLVKQCLTGDMEEID